MEGAENRALAIDDSFGSVGGMRWAEGVCNVGVGSRIRIVRAGVGFLPGQVESERDGEGNLNFHNVAAMRLH